MNQPGGTHSPAPKPRPERAIDARRRDAAAKVTAVDKAVKAIGRTGVPLTRAGVARLADVSRSFTYENDQADSLIQAAQSRTRTEPAERGEQMTAQQEAAWKERAINAEDHVRNLKRELQIERQLVADLLGRLREPTAPGSRLNATSSATTTKPFASSGTSSYESAASSNASWRGHGPTYPASPSTASHSCSPTALDRNARCRRPPFNLGCEWAGRQATSFRFRSATLRGPDTAPYPSLRSRPKRRGERQGSADESFGVANPPPAPRRAGQGWLGHGSPGRVLLVGLSRRPQDWLQGGAG